MVHIPALHVAQALPRRTRVTVGWSAAAALAALVLLFTTVSSEIAVVVVFGAVIATLCAAVMTYAKRHREPLDDD